nr:MAG TPA: hypothetical protein [Caudoviricetes sp.]
MSVPPLKSDTDVFRPADERTTAEPYNYPPKGRSGDTSGIRKK